MEIISVNGKKWSANRLLDAISLSATTGKIELMVVSGDDLKTYQVSYDGGPRYMTLTKKKDADDLLTEILKPL